ncbi:hypothetical protein EYF80_032784 [Liparis tanakae]|uniref:Uncharacterized protein n=1 Tax=Liparis tanakae TaxID=230148 RepID=A0A4Z2GWM2_9TELE|nr:hypothetical protein EYF80_032784 [Liparis tanakae]
MKKRRRSHVGREASPGEAGHSDRQIKTDSEGGHQEERRRRRKRKRRMVEEDMEREQVNINAEVMERNKRK